MCFGIVKLVGDNINRENILFELNKGMEDIEVFNLVDKFISQLQNTFYKSKYKIFSIEDIEKILIGEDIKLYTKDSKYIAIFIITLGIDIDKTLMIFEKTDKLGYIVFDKVCSHFIEEKTEELQKVIEKDLKINSKYALSRFSTGYGDFPICVNRDIVNILDANRMGIFLTDKDMFIPSKTISGIIASGDIVKSFNFCKTCNITQKCELIKKGDRCYE